MKRFALILTLLAVSQALQAQAWKAAYMDSLKAWNNQSIWIGKGATRYALITKDSAHFQNVSGDTATFTHYNGLTTGRMFELDPNGDLRPTTVANTDLIEDIEFMTGAWWMYFDILWMRDPNGDLEPRL